MEQTNITNDINQPVETSPINPIIPKPNDIYKYLFFITLIILFGFIIYFYTNTNNKSPQSLNNDINNAPKTTPTKEVSNNDSLITNTPTKYNQNQVSESFLKYNGKYFSLDYPDNWIITNFGQIFFHPKGTLIEDGNLPSQFFRVWEPSGGGHGGAAACYNSEANPVEPKSEEIIIAGHKGYKCYGNNGTAFVFVFSKIIEKGQESPLQIWFEFDNEGDESLVNKIMSSFTPKQPN